MPDADPGALAARQRKGVIVGAVFIAWGIIGALVSYYSDTNSLDIISILDASENAMVHAVLWCAAGAVVIFWYLAGPGSSPQKSGDDEDGRTEP